MIILIKNHITTDLLEKFLASPEGCRRVADVIRSKTKEPPLRSDAQPHQLQQFPSVVLIVAHNNERLSVELK